MRDNSVLAGVLRGEGLNVTPGVGYVLGLASFAIALLVRLAVFPVEAGFPFATFYPAVVMSALLFGWQPGLLTMALSVAAVDWLFMPPTAAGIESGLMFRTVIFVFSSAIVCALIGRARSHAAGVRKSEQQLRGLYEMSPLGIALTEIDGRFVDFNEAFRQICGYSEQELKNLDYWALTPRRYETKEAEQLQSLLQTGRYGPYEKEYIRKDGTPIPLQLTGMLITCADGRKFIWSIVEDITARKRSDALADLEQAVTRCLADARDGDDALRNVMRIICESERWESAGYFQAIDAAGTCRLVAGWSGPDARAATVEYYRSVKDTVVPPGGLLSRVIDSGKPIWIADMSVMETTWRERVNVTGQRATFAFPVWSDGRAIGAMAFSSPAIREPEEPMLRVVAVIGEQVGQVLKRKQAEAALRRSEQELRESEARFSGMFRLTPEPMALTRVKDGVLLEVSASYAQSLGYEGENLVGRSTAPADLGIWVDAGQRSRWVELIVEAGELLGFETPLRRRDGSIATFLISGKILRMGEEDCAIVVLHDISRQKQHEEHLSRIAYYDPLTTLPNRRLLSDRLHQAIAQNQRTSKRLAVCYLDLDGFKRVNDTLGHQVGDRVLQEVARRLLGAVRGGDTVARLGGDEFVLVLGGLNGHKECVAAVERLVQTVSAPYEIEGHRLHEISASVGVTVMPGDEADPDTLVHHADHAMYSAKQAGKNRFHFFDRPRAEQRAEARAHAYPYP